MQETKQLEDNSWLRTFHKTRRRAGEVVNRYHAMAREPALAYRDSDFQRLQAHQLKEMAEAADAATWELLSHIAPYQSKLSDEGELQAPVAVQAPVVVSDESRGRSSTDRGRTDPRVGAVYDSPPQRPATEINYHEETVSDYQTLRDEWHGRTLGYVDRNGHRQTDRVWLPPALAVETVRSVNQHAAELGWASDVVLPRADTSEDGIEDQVMVDPQAGGD